MRLLRSRRRRRKSEEGRGMERRKETGRDGGE